MPQLVIILFTRAHYWIYRLTGGQIGGGTMTGMQIIMLTTNGRRSGQPRTTPLAALVDGDRWIAVASNGGRPNHPQWYRNLVADPHVSVEVQRHTVSATARTATAEEKAVLWPRVIATARGYVAYQERTTRDIPVVIIGRA